MSSSTLAMIPALLGWEEGRQFGKLGGLRISEMENLILER